MSLQKVEAASEDASIDTIIRQAIGREPYLSFSRASGSPVQWSQLAYLPEWPLLYPMKIQMQKCEKCSREFCSTISYRRHLRLHRRKLNLDKDSAAKSRGLLQAFWDKLSVEEAIEIMSVDDISLEGVSGSSIVKALASVIRKPGYTYLPQTYVKPGSVLLDIVQGRRSRYPISSQELFDILDDASENTFLCAGIAESLQKFVFDGDAGKIGLEMRNLVVCTSFLVEQKLVKACLADKDAESLRYQKLLVDEEEAAQKRQAALLEKKRLKKLRQKELRAKELTNAESDVSPEKSSPSPPSSSPGDDYDTTIEMLEKSLDESATPEDPQMVNVEEYIVDDQENRQPEFGAHQMGHEDPQLVNVAEDIVEDQENKQPELGAHQMGHKELGAYQNLEHQRLHRNGQRQVVNSRWLAPKLHKYPNGIHNGQKHGSSRNSHTATNGTKVWTVKPKSEIDEVSSKSRLLVEAPKVPSREIKLLIGSIPVPLENRPIQVLVGSPGGVSEKCALNVSVPGENGMCEKAFLGDGNQVTAESSADIMLTPADQHDNGDHLPIYDSSEESHESIVLHYDSNVVQMTCVDEGSSNECEGSEDKSGLYVEGGYRESLKFSSHLAEAFLSQRWKEAIAADHVELELFPEEPPRMSAAQEDNIQGAVLSPKVEESNILRSAENRLPVRPTVKPKARGKPEKSSKVKYIQKQRSGF